MHFSHFGKGWESSVPGFCKPIYSLQLLNPIFRQLPNCVCDLRCMTGPEVLFLLVDWMPGTF